MYTARPGKDCRVSLICDRNANDDLAASLSNFSPREWGLDLAEPLPHEEGSAPPPQVHTLRR